MFFLDNFISDCVHQTLFLSTVEATKRVCKAFENYVTVTVWLFFLLLCYAVVYSLSLCLSALLASKRVH